MIVCMELAGASHQVHMCVLMYFKESIADALRK